MMFENIGSMINENIHLSQEAEAVFSDEDDESPLR